MNNLFELMIETLDPSSLEIQDDFNRDIWEEDDKLDPVITERLMAIAQDFLDKLKMNNLEIHDIILTGSLANYNWSKYSDFDLHIVLDFRQVDENQKLVKDFFNAKKTIWNRTHEIYLRDYEVEVYVQDRGEPHESNGIYSVMYDKWTVKPQYGEVKLDKENSEKKAEDITRQIDDAEKLFRKENFEQAETRVQQIKDKIKKMRKSGLESGGVYSVENLAFKLLRRSKDLKRLMELGTDSYDKRMSLDN